MAMTGSSGKVSRRDALKNMASATLGVGAVLTRGVTRAESQAAPIRHPAGWKQEPPNAAHLPPNRPAWMMAPGRALTGYGAPSM
ncbi:exported hypothetical protein [Paraburkholderia ribeironis]|uniref:Uncharacterized protein n=1 Tax=Paraburkholderia ribeironis TaxID=1247936 RepID=A0A1N7SLW1_9BURK|nr:exported hypothetical protein [Paraburkholderia ribeironis]